LITTAQSVGTAGRTPPPANCDVQLLPFIEQEVRTYAISASVFWLILAVTGSGWHSFPKRASSRSARANLFSLELKS
jgi:hypothetical protein